MLEDMAKVLVDWKDCLNSQLLKSYRVSDCNVDTGDYRQIY